MVNLTRICTKTGDDGTTALGDVSRTSKLGTRLAVYADVDEANWAAPWNRYERATSRRSSGRA
ncbi:hypothetical protein GCM10010508_16350 [Streptomyces naganishii JCM 4654]|uniref:Cobalamin adenosyltransferase-like domain-containing protein n=1 Tax=Streptomyces naganishii JCM 4654 TaxID=1306179 RepID=A0A919CVQ6_9ACTN|nr:hypothetical protein GCM10010508_16350 [Streptomyces naganishii JCM 4654]